MKFHANTREEFALRAAKHWHGFWSPLDVGPLGTLLWVTLPEVGSRGYFVYCGGWICRLSPSCRILTESSTLRIAHYGRAG